jgi:hypothetical protein
VVAVAVVTIPKQVIREKGVLVAVAKVLLVID